MSSLPQKSDERSKQDHEAAKEMYYASLGSVVTTPQAFMASELLVVELPRKHWPVGPQPLGRPHCDERTTRAVSLVLLLKELNDAAGQPSFMEMLVDRDMYRRSQEEEAEMYRSAVRQHSVMGYRFYFPGTPDSVTTMSMMLNTYLTRSAAHTAAAAATVATASGGGGRRSRSVAEADLLPGRFDTTPRRHQTEHDFRSDVAHMRGGQAEDVLPFSTACTYEIPPLEAPPFRISAAAATPLGEASDDDDDGDVHASGAASSAVHDDDADDGYDAMFGEVPADDAGSAPAADDVDPKTRVPKTHVLYPLTADSFFRAQFVQHRHKAWNLPDEQLSLESVWNQAEGRLEFRGFVVRERLVRRMMGDVADVKVRCLPEFEMSEELLRTQMKQLVMMAGNDITPQIDRMSGAEIREITAPDTGTFIDPAELNKVPVDANHAGAQNQYMNHIAGIYPGMTSIMYRNLGMKPHYLKRKEHAQFLKNCVQPGLTELRLTHNYGAPDIFRLVQEDLNRRGCVLRDDEYTVETVYARNAMQACGADLRADRRMVRFGSWFVKWFGAMALNWFQLTRVQGSVAEFAYGSMARAGDLRSALTLMSIGLIGAPDLGKSQIISAVADMLPGPARAKATQSGSALCDLVNTPGEIACQDERHHAQEQKEARLSSHSLAGERHHQRLEKMADGSWAVRTYKFLAGLHKFFACNQMPGDAWKSRSTIITPKSDPCENGMTTSSFASGCRRKGQRAAGELVLKQLGCYWYEMCSVINIGGCEVSDLIVNILFKVAQAVDPKAFQRLKNRHIDTIRNTAIALMYQRVTALYHLKLKTPESSELDMLRFYSHSLVVAPEDALRAFARVVHFVDRTDDDLDLAAALRSLITFDHGKPETSNDGRYYMLSITTGSEDRTVMSQLPGKAKDVGIGFVKDRLEHFQQERFGNETILLRGVGKGAPWQVLKAFVQQPGVETPANSVIWAALVELADTDKTWSFDRDTEEDAIFPKAARDRLLEHGRTANGLRALAGQPPIPIQNELRLMAEGGDIQFEADPHALVHSEPYTRWGTVVHDPDKYEGVNVPGEPVLDGGNIEMLRGQTDLRKTPKLETDCLSVPFERILQKKLESEGRRRDLTTFDMQQIFHEFSGVTGGFLPGEEFVQGISTKGKPLYETFVAKAIKPGDTVTFESPNRDPDSKGTCQLKADFKPRPGPTVEDSIFDPRFQSVCVQHGADIYAKIMAEHSRRHTGEARPAEWLPEACEFAERTVTVVGADGSETHTVCVPRSAPHIGDWIVEQCGKDADDYSVRAYFNKREFVIGEGLMDFWIRGPDDDTVFLVDEQPVTPGTSPRRPAKRALDVAEGAAGRAAQRPRGPQPPAEA
jgi:hypothetical protein